MKKAPGRSFWYVPYLVQAIGFWAVLFGLTNFLSDDAATSAFRSLPSPRTACPVVVVHHTPASGSRWFITDKELETVLKAFPKGTPWLLNVSRRKVKGDPPVGAYRQEGAAPVARSEELIRSIPQVTLDHARAIREAIRGKGFIVPQPWWAFWPLMSQKKLLDPSLLRWVDTMSLARAQSGKVKIAGDKVLIIGNIDAQGGPLTYCGQISETMFLGVYFSALLAGRQIQQPSLFLSLFLMIGLSFFVAFLYGRFGRLTASIPPLILFLFIGPVARIILARSPLWIDPVPFQTISLLILLAPWQFGSPVSEKERRHLALTRVRELWENEGREGWQEALSELARYDENAALAWEAIEKQEELKDEECINPADLPLHLLDVEELYQLGYILEQGYHWNESLMLYDWAAMKRLDYKDLITRRNEAKDAVLGNLEFIDIDEITESVDKRYEKLEMLGQGGMGVVLRGWDSYLERPIALKLIMPNCLTDEVARERFLREIETLSSLNHDQVVQVFNVHRDETLLYYTMELLDGKSLQEVIGVDVECSWQERFSVLADMASVLAFVHEKGIYHRDLKPDNVLIVEGRGPVLIDFGIAKAQEHAEGLTQAGQLIGTLAYMAPELVRGGGGGKEADIFAFGVIMYEVLSGKLPFTNPVTLKAKKPSLPSSHREDLPKETEELILRLMALEPEERPDSFAIVAQELREMAQK